MSDEKKNKPDKQDKKKEKNKLDKELRQTFPASDPPSHSRPGHERSESEGDKS
ncbi:hypothetical protein [Rhodohalobacter sp. SW132]|uniref:hypothetical protein n=1 Tax=Rhodohalobacter sp. SW132 TaxID=2293433 RepID=UPI0018F52B9E|nr:hypothetical protein [Rhodohalobacter sp. SW132]